MKTANSRRAPRSGSNRRFSQAPPVRGRTVRDIQLFDAVMLKYGTKIGCTSAELSISRHGVVIIARGYGSSDRFGRVTMHPNNPMAIASCEKPITAAVVKQLARAGKLDLNASIFRVLEIQPVGPIVDGRVWDVTIQHVLDHKAGWQGAPLDQAVQAARARGFVDNVTEIWLRFLMAQRLKDAPGAKEEYSNFGYDVLRLLIARTTGRPSRTMSVTNCAGCMASRNSGDPIARRGDSG